MVDDYLCVIRFSNEMTKSFWENQLVSMHSKDPPKYIKWLMAQAKQNYVEVKSSFEREIPIKNMKQEKKSLFYKLEDIQNNELVIRIQTLSESNPV